MLSKSFTVTITAEDLHDLGLISVTNDELSEITTEFEVMFQEEYFSHILRAAALDIGILT